MPRLLLLRGVRLQLLAIEFEPVSHQPVPHAAGDLLLKPLDLGTAELDHPARGTVNQVIVVALRCLLLAGSPVTELVPGQDTFLLQTLDSPIHGGKRHTIISRYHPLM